jgi:TPR repeat protein
MTTDMLGDPARADNMAEHFASLLYRVVAGRNCPVAASLSSQAYVAIPSLSEQSNRILALVIARQVEDSSCGKVLREILNTEGIVPRVAGHSSAGCTVRPGSSTVSPLTPPPVTPVDRAPAAPPRSATSLGKRTKRNSLVAIGAAVAFILFVGLSLFVGRRQPPVEKTKGTQPTTVAISPAGQKDYNSAIEYIAGLNKVQINEPKALELLQRAVAHHFPEAEARLAAWTMFGVNGARKDSAKASALAQQSLSDGLETAAGSRATAQYELASLYRQGLGVEKDVSKAAQWYQKAANQGLAAAQNNLGVLYQNGNGVEKDLTKAAELYRKAADQGFAGAQNNLGISYQNGNGVEKDLTKAAELYQKAADQGEARAQTNLGWLFENGNGVPKDFNKAAQLYQKAADQGFAGAQSNLGILYQNGNGVEKDLTKAAELCQKAADQGEAKAQTNLGWLFENGNGVPKDFNKAAQLYQKAADQGFAPAQNNLGALYQNGNGVEKDLTKAAELYQKAADQGEPYAQKNLGGLYEYGMGVAKDVNKAAELYQKSADQGNQAARDSLRRLGQH